MTRWMYIWVDGRVAGPMTIGEFRRIEETLNPAALVWHPQHGWAPVWMAFASPDGEEPHWPSSGSDSPPPPPLGPPSHHASESQGVPDPPSRGQRTGNPVAIAIGAVALLAGGLLILMGLGILGPTRTASTDAGVGPPTSVHESASPEITDSLTWDPRNRLQCGDSQYASNIELFSVMYLDCQMAQDVSRQWALGGELPGIAGNNTAPWRCSRGHSSYGESAFGSVLPPGHVECVGYRGSEYLRFLPQ